MKTKKIMPESFYKFDKHMDMKKLSRAKDNGNFVVARVLRWDQENKVLIVRFGKNFRGIIPLSEISFGCTNISAEIKSLIGKNICVLVQEILDDHTVLLSRRKNIVNAYKYILKCKNVTLNCTITGIQPYAIFVDVGHGVHGIIFVNDLYACYPDYTKLLEDEKFAIGNTIIAKIKSIDKEKNRICLTHKELFKNLSYSINQGDKVKAIIASPLNYSPNTYYVYVNPNTAGIIKIPNKISVSYGSKVIAQVLEPNIKRPEYLRLKFICLI